MAKAATINFLNPTNMQQAHQTCPSSWLLLLLLLFKIVLLLLLCQEPAAALLSCLPSTFCVLVARMMISVRMGVTRTSTPE